MSIFGNGVFLDKSTILLFVVYIDLPLYCVM